jgi:hypothetical protein
VATRGELAMFIIGHIFAALMGLVIPLFSLFLGNAFNAFGP